VPLPNAAPRHGDVRRRGCVAPGITKHGTRFSRKVAGSISVGVIGILH